MWTTFGLIGPPPSVPCLALVMLAATALPQAAAAQPPEEQVRVRTAHANVQAGPTSGAQVLVLVPRGTVLPVIERRGPWVLVRISPALRKTGTPMRWYRQETQGFIHDFALEPPGPGSPRARHR